MEQRLSKLAGIRPTLEWLDACKSFLEVEASSNNNNNDNGEDEILHQIIHTDLRNVVRHVTNNTNDNHGSYRITNENEPLPNSIILRQSISKSIQNVNQVSSSSSSNNNNSNSNSNNSVSKKASLPETFRHMVQIEELLDVSKNAEDRLSLGPSSATSPTPIGNQKKRCLKLLLSDGYYADGSTSSNNDNNGHSTLSHNTVDSYLHQHFVAMETEPIHQLSVHSKPGIKIILSGPIPIYMGILLLHPNNIIVLGGYIPDLIPIQKKAIECAAKLAGVGIDPTFRALVWNPDSGIDDENDEGEQESGDIIPNTTNSVISTMTSISNNTYNSQQQPILNNSNNNSNVTDNINRRVHSQNENNINNRIIENNVVRNVYSTMNNHQNSVNDASYQNETNDINQATHHNQSTTSTTNNPYATSNHKPTTNNTNNNNFSIASTAQHENPSNGTVQYSQTSSTSANCNNKVVNVYAAKNKNIDGMKIQIPSTDKSKTFLSSQIPLSPTALSEPLSFTELRNLLLQIIHDPDLYQQYYTKTFIVPCKMHSEQSNQKKLGFNVEKNKNYKKEKKPKWGYVMGCQIAGANEIDGTITCKLTNDCIQPFLSIEAGEMRKLAHEDKAEANRIANHGGTQIISDLLNLAPCALKLLYPKDDFFGDKSPFEDKVKSVDGDIPILELFSRKNN